LIQIDRTGNKIAEDLLLFETTIKTDGVGAAAWLRYRAEGRRSYPGCFSVRWN